MGASRSLNAFRTFFLLPDRPTCRHTSPASTRRSTILNQPLDFTPTLVVLLVLQHGTSRCLSDTPPQPSPEHGPRVSTPPWAALLLSPPLSLLPPPTSTAYKTVHRHRAGRARGRAQKPVSLLEGSHPNTRLYASLLTHSAPSLPPNADPNELSRRLTDHLAPYIEVKRVKVIKDTRGGACAFVQCKVLCIRFLLFVSNVCLTPHKQ
jgi:hypothetical protein